MIDKYPEEMLERAYNHTKDKYGISGYAKHYVVDDEYNQFKNKILLIFTSILEELLTHSSKQI